MAETLGIEIVCTSPVSPWINGIAERRVCFSKGLIRKALMGVSKDKWTTLIPWVQSAINCTVSRTTGLAPHEAFFGEPPSPLISGDPTLEPAIDWQLGIKENA